MFRILTSNTIEGLEEQLSKYDIRLLGALVISNGHFFQSFVGSPLSNPAVKKPAVNSSKPKRKPRASATKTKPKEEET